MNCRFSLATLAIFTMISSAPVAYGADSAQTASGASTHASQAVTMGIAASGQTTLGLIATPLLSVGAVGHAVGAASTAAGNSAAAASLQANGPLAVTDETITISSPTEALKPRAPTTPR